MSYLEVSVVSPRQYLRLSQGGARAEEALLVHSWRRGDSSAGLIGRHHQVQKVSLRRGRRANGFQAALLIVDRHIQEPNL